MDVVLSAGIYNQSVRLSHQAWLTCSTRNPSTYLCWNMQSCLIIMDIRGFQLYAQAELSLISLNKYASQTIRMLAEMTLESTFRKRAGNGIRNRKQQHLVNIERPLTLPGWPYLPYVWEGTSLCKLFRTEDFDQVTPEELLHDFYRERVQASQWIMICGMSVIPFYKK